MRGWNEKKQEWSNVTKNIVIKPQYMYAPKTKAELIDAVKFANNHNLKVRVAALGHSTSALVSTSEVLIMTDHLQQIKVNEKNQTVWFESGVSIMQVEAALRKVGLCVPHSVLSREFFWVGCQTTNSHGSGIKYGGMNHFLIHTDIVDAEGTMRRFIKEGYEISDDTKLLNEAEKRSDIFQAVMSTMGLMGVIYAVTLKAEPIYKVKVTDIKIPFSLDTGVIPEDLRRLVLMKDSVEFNWFLTDTLWVRYFERTEEELTTCCCCCTPDVKDSWERLNEAFKTGAGQVLLLPMLENPSVTPLFSQFAAASIPTGTQVRWVPDAIHIMHLFYGTDIGVEFLEFGFLCDDNWDNVGKAWKIAVDKLHAYNKDGKYPINALIQSRFTGINEALLSPHVKATGTKTDVLSTGPQGKKAETNALNTGSKIGTGPTGKKTDVLSTGPTGTETDVLSTPTPIICWIELVTFCKQGGAGADYIAYTQEVGAEWMKLSGHPHPHWAKRFRHVPGIINHIHKVFKETNNGLQRFMDIRRELRMDPHDRFVNPYLRELFTLHSDT